MLNYRACWILAKQFIVWCVWLSTWLFNQFQFSINYRGKVPCKTARESKYMSTNYQVSWPWKPCGDKRQTKTYLLWAVIVKCRGFAAITVSYNWPVIRRFDNFVRCWICFYLGFFLTSRYNTQCPYGVLQKSLTL